MSPQSILLEQIIVVFATILLTNWYATQWVAAALAFDPYLGSAKTEKGQLSFKLRKVRAKARIKNLTQKSKDIGNVSD